MVPTLETHLVPVFLKVLEANAQELQGFAKTVNSNVEDNLLEVSLNMCNIPLSMKSVLKSHCTDEDLKG